MAPGRLGLRGVQVVGQQLGRCVAVVLSRAAVVTLDAVRQHARLDARTLWVVGDVVTRLLVSASGRTETVVYTCVDACIR